MLYLDEGRRIVGPSSRKRLLLLKKNAGACILGTPTRAAYAGGSYEVVGC
jgi:hypothetical protein